MTPLSPRPPQAPTGDGTHVVFIPHAAAIVYAGLFLAVLAILLWREHVAFVRACTCQKKPTLLRPRWKKVDPRDDYDRYEEDD